MKINKHSASGFLIFKSQNFNIKWFDKLTTLSQVEGQITRIHPLTADQTFGSLKNVIWDLSAFKLGKRFT